MIQDISNHASRADFKNLFVANCTSDEFELIGIDMLMNDEIFNTYLSNLEKGLTEEEMNVAFRVEIINALIVNSYSKFIQTKQKEENTMNTTTTTITDSMSVTMDDTVNPPVEPQDPRDAEILALRAELEAKNKEEAIKEKETQTEKKKPDAPKATTSKSKGFNWKAACKTAAITTVGMAVGAGGLYLYNRFMK